MSSLQVHGTRYKVQGVFVFISILILPLVFFGLGCGKSREAAVGSRQSTAVSQATGTGQIAEADEAADEEEVGDPMVLAYLLLTKDAKVTVSRGEESTDGINHMELYAGDRITVMSGEARLLYPDIGISVLEEGTILEIVPSEHATNGGMNVDLILEAGKIWTRLERLLGMDQDFSVEASDVVATVRGTAFGVMIADGQVDITVADHQVQVSTRKAIQGLKDVASKAVNLAAGNKLRVKPGDLAGLDNPRAAILKTLRSVTDTEKQDLFYRFAQRKLDTAALKKPDIAFKWSVPININPRMLERLTPLQIRRLQLIRARQEFLRSQLQKLEDAQRLKILQEVRFQAPLREVMLENFQPTSTPSVIGPSG